MNLNNKNILLGITGGIAAFKSADLTHQLRNSGANVRVVMTPGAMKFVTPLTFQALSGNDVVSEIFDPTTKTGMEHIDLARWADVILIAPATANFISQLANGAADNLLSTLCVATTKPILVAPSMNREMWLNELTQGNIKKIQQNGVQILGPAAGIQACGDIGPGRMLEVVDLIECVSEHFANSGLLKGQRVLITAGATREAIDPVRYITNRSSGKMGYAMAKAAARAGAEVTLVSGPTNMVCPSGVRCIKVTTAREMLEAVMQEVKENSIFIGAAAVADYRPKEEAVSKIKKKDASLTLEMERTEDILARVAGMEGGPVAIGFAAETDDLLENARSKLENKKLYAIVANPVGKAQGFDKDENEATVLFKEGTIEEFSKTSKNQLARQLIGCIGKRLADPDFKAFEKEGLECSTLV